MLEQYHKWFSPALGRDIEMMTYGDRGLPVVAFPTSLGKYYQNKDFGLIESVRWFVENGFVKIYCIDGFDEHCWYNRNVEPAVRAYNHVCYDNMLHHELIPAAKNETGFSKVAVAGCSFGGYHAANYAFKHAENVSHMIAMGAAFSIRDQVDGYFDDTIYFNNPPDFLPGTNHPELWNMKIFLGTTETDSCKDANLEMSNILQSKGISHWLDIRPYGGHDWPIWCEMFPHYLSLR